MTEDELAAIEAHAQAVDSRMSENCLRLVAALRASRAGRALVEQHLLAERDEARALVKGMHDELVPGGRPLDWHSWIEAGKKLNEWDL